MVTKALITGATGQDGAYLAQFLLEKGYKVFGTFRRASQPNFGRLHELGILGQVELVPFDLLDQSSIVEAFQKIKPDEIYNLAAQSFVGASFEQAVATGEITGLGLTRVLDSMRLVCPEAKFYQASSSEMFGNTTEIPQRETTAFCPASPYAAAKLYAHWVTKTYREAYRLFLCTGILFNHESPLRGIEFVTRKITYSVARIKHGLQKEFRLGNLKARRDWGYAKDYVKCMWMMLQQPEPDDYVIATGESHSVEEFAALAFARVGLNWKDYVVVDESLFRPADVNSLLGDLTKAVSKLQWNPKSMAFEELVALMVDADMYLVNSIIKSQNMGFDGVQVHLYPHFKE